LLFMSRVSSKPYFAYILWSPSAGRFYIGISEDPATRLAQHNSGMSKWSSRYTPWKLVLTERFENYADARKREVLLKQQKGGMGFYKQTGLDPSKFQRSVGSSGS